MASGEIEYPVRKSTYSASMSLGTHNLVKNSIKNEYTGVKKSEKHSCKRKRSRRNTDDASTDDSIDLAGTSGISSGSTSILTTDMTEREIPEIISYISSKTLARHAGELLLDLHKYRSDEDGRNLTLSGMIVDGTKVYFTLLDMSASHHSKLELNGELYEGDRAIVYYAKPLDILRQDDRDLIIESLVMLHNI